MLEEDKIREFINDIRLAVREKKDEVNKKIKEFKRKQNDVKEIFSELCFCILTANFNAEKSLIMQETIGDGFLNLPYEELKRRLSELGHRYPNTRAEYIVNARKHINEIKDIISLPSKEAREKLVKKIKGLGYKESSHFLRNIGKLDVAIIDYHIIDLLFRYGIIDEKPKALTKKKYLQIENILEKISNVLGLCLGELDLYLWYMETGKIIK